MVTAHPSSFIYSDSRIASERYSPEMYLFEKIHTRRLGIKGRTAAISRLIIIILTLRCKCKSNDAPLVNL